MHVATKYDGYHLPLFSRPLVPPADHAPKMAILGARVLPPSIYVDMPMSILRTSTPMYPSKYTCVSGTMLLITSNVQGRILAVIILLRRSHNGRQNRLPDHRIPPPPYRARGDNGAAGPLPPARRGGPRGCLCCRQVTAETHPSNLIQSQISPQAIIIPSQRHQPTLRLTISFRPPRRFDARTPFRQGSSRHMRHMHGEELQHYIPPQANAAAAIHHVQTRLGVGVGLLAWGVLGLHLADRAEEKFGYTPSEQDKEDLRKWAPRVIPVEKPAR
ncbi:hypothetical protein RJ55_08257 [Drechmeria coniospora]|nr:hypothetical protein RJ55_08257 [Drechmeria coniospora]